MVGIDALGGKFLFELVTVTGVHRCRPNELLVCWWLIVMGFLVMGSLVMGSLVMGSLVLCSLV